MGGEASQPHVQSRSQASPIEALVNMGFPRDVVLNALSVADNDFERALQMLIDQKEAEERNKRAAAVDRRAQTSFQRSSISNSSARRSTSSSTTKPSSQLAQPDSKAARTTTSPETLQDIANRIAERSQAIDTLHYVLNTLWENPHEAKYRSLKTNNTRFLETLGSDVRLRQQVELFLSKLGFERAGEWLSLPPNYNRSLIKQALDALNHVKANNPAYETAKRIAEFEKAVEISRETASEEEKARRAVFAAKIPPIPAEGAAGTTRINVIISEGAPPLSRRFVADDTLADVVNWIGSERSIVCNKILDGSWFLVDETLLQKKALTVPGVDLSKTLHALGLWPSATLHVRLNKPA